MTGTAGDERTQTDVWRTFHHASRMYAGYMNVRLTGQPAIDIASRRATYPLAEKLGVEPVTVPSDVGLAIIGRRSTRQFHGRVPKGAVDAVARWAFDGRLDESRRGRPTPSAGAMYPLELYLLPMQVEGLPSQVLHLSRTPGHPAPRWSKLGELPDFEYLNRAFLGQLHAGTGGVFVIAADVPKSTVRYGQRGYRFCLLEAGHVAQNLCLALADAGLACFCVGGFSDTDVASLVGIEDDRVPVYSVAFGNSSPTEPAKGAT